MRAVIDTNVLAYMLLGTEQHVDEARSLMATLDEALAPAVWEAELTNVLWMAARQKVLTVGEAAHRLVLADGLGISSVPNHTLWQGALLRAYRSGLAAYDALFVELAARGGLPLATFDAAVLKAFPDVAVRPAVLLPK